RCASSWWAAATSIDVASVARRLGHIGQTHAHDVPISEEFGHTATDVAGTLRREGVKAVLTSLFPIEQMTAAEREREDAKREGIEIAGGVMPQPIDGSEYEIECDMIISAIGQMADFAEGLQRLDGGRGAIAIDAVYQVKKMPKHFAGGDALRPHLLTTAIGHGRIAAETISDFLAGHLGERRPKVDSHQFNLLAELHNRGLDPAPYDHRQESGTDNKKFAVHNYEDRGATQIIPHDALFKGHF